MEECLGTILWSDDDGCTGARVALQVRLGTLWECLEVPMGIDYKVFDAELVGMATALEWTLDRGLDGSIYVLLDAQATIDRL